MNPFKEISLPKESEQTEKVKETDRPQTKDSDIPFMAPVENKSRADLSDDLNSAFKTLGLTAETNSENKTETNESSESKDYSKYLEKGEDGKYYDQETGKTYDSVEAWKKSQETLAKRYESTSHFYEDKANKEYARFKNSEQNGESETEKWNHYKRSQEYYAKAKEYMESSEHIRQKLENSKSDSLEVTTKNINENGISQKEIQLHESAAETDEAKETQGEASTETPEKSDINEGLTNEQKALIMKETGWPKEIVDCIESMDQYEVYKKANLHYAEINGRPCLVKGMDMDYVDPKTGLTNRELLEKGRTPIDAKTGERIELHHMGQDYNSPFAELCENSEHGDGNDSVLHDKKVESWRNNPSMKNEYNNHQRPEHWKSRLTEE